MSVRIIFMGTPDFAVPALAALVSPVAKGRGYDVVTVVTQPDRPSGRGKRLTPSPVKVEADSAGLRVLQPETLRTEAAFAALAELQPDLVVVAAFGQILRKNVLELPRYGCLNIHASLLPRWRGAAPIAAAIQAGDKETGVSLMLMDEGLDTGPVLARWPIPIKSTDTTGTLTIELAEAGAGLLLDTLPAWLAGEIRPEPQEERLATLAPRLKKEDGAINWKRSAVEIERQVRAFDPWPGAFTEGPRGSFKLLAVEVAPDVVAPKPAEPGTLFQYQRGVYVLTGEGVLRLVAVQPAGKKPMPAEAMLHGQPELREAKLGTM